MANQNKQSEQKINLAHEIFITEMIAHGNRRIAYQKAYPDASDRTAHVNSCRLLATRPDIAQRIRAGILQAQEAAMNLLKETYEDKIADIQEKRQVLAQIIRGELVAETEIHKGSETHTVRHIANPKERMNAIVIDNKMEEQLKELLKVPNNGVILWG